MTRLFFSNCHARNTKRDSDNFSVCHNLFRVISMPRAYIFKQFSIFLRYFYYVIPLLYQNRLLLKCMYVVYFSLLFCTNKYVFVVISIYFYHSCIKVYYVKRFTFFLFWWTVQPSLPSVLILRFSLSFLSSTCLC